MEEKKIALDPLELKVLKMFIDHKYEPMAASEEESRAMDRVIDKADALMDELHADDELGNSLMEWFWNKYRKQEGIED